MTPGDLADYLQHIVARELRLSLMLWGPPGIGKSSIVAQVAAAQGLSVIDLRLSQLAPTDLRGLPVASGETARWLPPEFLPREGRGVLFLDELNMAPPTLQGIAQQLILDRRVGSYALPDGWFVWAAGNRAEDRAAVFEMPAPLANRFLHLDIEPDFESFRTWALRAGIHPDLLAFLHFRPGLLYSLTPDALAWPSPRTWEMAHHLHSAGLSMAPAVGAAAAAEVDAFLASCRDLPDLEEIFGGTSRASFPEEPSRRYALVTALAAHAATSARAAQAFRWLAAAAASEWVQLFLCVVVEPLQTRGELGAFAAQAQEQPSLRSFLTRSFEGMERALATP